MAPRPHHPRRRALAAVAGLALALLLSAFAGPSTASDADAGEVVAMADGAKARVTTDLLADRLVPADHVYPRSPYANAPRIVTTTTTAPPPPPTTTTTAPPPPPPAPAGSIEGIIEAYFGPAASRAKAIARCESNMNPRAQSPTNDHGLFQINAVHRNQFQSVTGQPWSAVYDADANTRYAKYLYDREGWSPWVCNRKV